LNKGNLDMIEYLLYIFLMLSYLCSMTMVYAPVNYSLHTEQGVYPFKFK
jgi:hypothetical protein